MIKLNLLMNVIINNFFKKYKKFFSVLCTSNFLKYIFINIKNNFIFN